MRDGHAATHYVGEPLSITRSTATLLAVLTLLAAACNGAADDPTTTSTTATTVPTTTTQPPPTAPPVDRLLVLDTNGNVATMDRNGENVELLTDDAGTGSGYFQPTWSPDGQSVVVSRLNTGQFSLMSFDLEAGTSAEVPVQNNAFYVHWSPQSDRVGYLSTGPGGMALAIAEFGETPASTQVELGAPFYFSWSPDGERLATLIGQQRLEVWDTVPGGNPVEIAAPGAFLNPAWTDAGLFYITELAGTDTLVVGTPGGGATALARTPGPVAFTAPSSGARVAIQATGSTDGISASFQEAPLLPINQLVVVETATREVTPVTTAPALAYFWDSSGEQLLVFDQDDAAQMFRWSVWKDGELRELVKFLPSQLFLQTFLPFFSQYALSTTMWSPDGNAFAFAGLVDGVGGIYVQNVAGGPPELVAEGAGWVSWSPR